MRKSVFCVSGSLVAVAATLAWTPSSALAQDAGNEPTSGAAKQKAAEQSGQRSGLSEIVVTATRRTTNLQSTPVAVSAVDSQLIAQSNPKDLGDLSIYVPNFSASKITGFNAASFAMRGLGQNNIIVYFEPPVGVLVDDFVVPSVQTQLLDTFDISQVEVLRGPQGTLFGKNTTGGAVVVKTKRPDMIDFGVEVRARYGSFNTRQIQASLDLPIIPGQLAARFVGGYEKSDGYYHNGACYGPVTDLLTSQQITPSKFAGAQGCGDGSSLGGKDVFNGRAKLQWEPSADVTILAQYEILRDHSATVPSVNETPNDPANFLFSALNVGSPQYSPYGASLAHSDPLDNAGVTNRDSSLMFMSKGHRVDVDGYYLNMDFNVGVGKFTSITGYRNQRSRLPSTYTGQAPVAPDGDVLSLFDATRDDNRNTFQQEVRFSSDFSGPFDFVAGAFYQHENIDFCVNQLLGFLDLTYGPLPFGAWNDSPYILCNGQKSNSTAVYAQGNYKLTDKLTFTAGGRYTWEDKTWRGRQQVFIPQLNGGFDPSITINEALDASVYKFTAGTVDVNNKASSPSWHFGLSYQATPDFFLYASYTRGFKSGGFNDQIGSFHPFVNTDGSDNPTLFAAAAAPTKPEYADSFEAGIKTESFDHRLRFNLTGFYVKYRDLQKQIVVPLDVGGQTAQVTTYFNAASATVKGLEGELTATPAEGLTFHGVLGYQDAHYDKYVTPIAAGYDLATAPMDRAPKWQWTIAANYHVPITQGLKVEFNGDISYTGRNLFTQSIVTPDQNTFLEARTLLNASITLAQSDDAWWIRGIARNITDKRYRVSSQVVGGLWTFTQYGEPRYFGVEVGMKFGSAR